MMDFMMALNTISQKGQWIISWLIFKSKVGIVQCKCQIWHVDQFWVAPSQAGKEPGAFASKAQH